MSEYRFNDLREGIKSILLTSCFNDVFTDCSVAWYSPLLQSTETVTVRCNNDEEDNTEKGLELPLFDLASLTKPLVTLLCVLTLIDRKIISMEDSLELLLDRKIPDEYRFITLKSILCHCSGLPAHVEFWRELKDMKEENRKEAVIESILMQIIKSNETPETHIYSDLGYILLGFVVEKQTGKRLGDFWEEEIAIPLGIESTVNFPQKLEADKEKYVITGRCPWSNDLLQGIVHDDNCRVLGGVCGHAGLFGTASGVLTLCQEMYFHLKKKNSRLPFSHEIFESCSKRISDSEWTYGFNLPSMKGSSSGLFFCKESLGHLGFTGTSFWIDHVNDLIVVLLTNRVVKGDNMKGIQELRPLVHDFLAKRLIKRENRYSS